MCVPMHVFDEKVSPVINFFFSWDRSQQWGSHHRWALNNNISNIKYSVPINCLSWISNLLVSWNQLYLAKMYETEKNIWYIYIFFLQLIIHLKINGKYLLIVKMVIIVQTRKWRKTEGGAKVPIQGQRNYRLNNITFQLPGTSPDNLFLLSISKCISDIRM